MKIEDIPTRNFILGILITPIFFGVGGYFLIYHLGRDVRFWMQTRDGLEVPVQAVVSVSQRHSNEGTGEIQVEYTYDVAGTRFTGTAASVHEHGDNFGPFLQTLYDKIAAAKAGRRSLTCFVNRSNPSIAVIDNTLRPSRVAVETLFSIGFMGAGGAGFVSSVRNLRTRLREPKRGRSEHTANDAI